MVLLCLALYAGGCGEKSKTLMGNQLPYPKDTDYVNLEEYIPDLLIRLAYYTEDNFTGQKLYDSPVAYLRRGTANKLKRASDQAMLDGYRLVILDAYRPPGVQFKMWKKFPDSRFLANPNKGFSDHARGCAVDLTLSLKDGSPVEMPSKFDEFSARANRDYSDVSPAQGANARYLEKIMTQNGFFPVATEWWHFADVDRKKYGVGKDGVSRAGDTNF
jgi:D-alanyl-D-alanine dipeptidase